MYIIPKIIGAHQLFLRHNGAQTIPTNVSTHIGVIVLGQFSFICAKKFLLYWRIVHRDLRQSRLNSILSKVQKFYCRNHAFCTKNFLLYWRSHWNLHQSRLNSILFKIQKLYCFTAEIMLSLLRIFLLIGPVSIEICTNVGKIQYYQKYGKFLAEIINSVPRILYFGAVSIRICTKVY